MGYNQNTFYDVGINFEDNTGKFDEEQQVSPFEDVFKSKWWHRYNSVPKKCSLENIQTLYDYNKLTLEDFRLITGEDPVQNDGSNQNVILSEKVTALEEKVAILENTVNSLVAADEPQF